jgi:hypothetical protein
MKRSDWFFNIGIVALIIGIIVVVLFKFVLNQGPSGQFKIETMSQVQLLDLNKNNLKLTDLLEGESDSYCLIFELTNCYSCIYKGLEDLKILQKSGSNCFAIAINDYADDVEGWSKNHNFSPFFVLKKIDFYKYFQSSLLPVLIKLNKEGVKSYRFITP